MSHTSERSPRPITSSRRCCGLVPTMMLLSGAMAVVQASDAVPTITTNASGVIGATKVTKNAVVVYKVTFDKAALTGNLVTTAVQVASYTESDVIDPAPPLESQIPAAMFLQVPIEDSDRFRPATNDFATQDCDSDPCELAVDSTCTTMQQVSATLTGYEGAEDYGAVGNARQNAGM